MLILKFDGVAHIVRQNDLKMTLCGVERPTGDDAGEIHQPYEMESTCKACQEVAMQEIRETKPLRPLSWGDTISDYLK